MEQVLAFIDRQQQEQRQLLHQLRQIILESAPHIEERIKWKIPFYSYQGLLCYLNLQAKGNGVVLGFCRGAMLSNEQRLLQGNGKEVRLVIFNDQDSLPKEEIRQLLQEAMLLNETMQRRKNYYV